MTLHELIRRKPVPEPWAEGDNIPWHEDEFSKRMLQEHFTQKHDAASRRTGKIDWLVDWVHCTFLVKLIFVILSFIRLLVKRLTISSHNRRSFLSSAGSRAFF